MLEFFFALLRSGLYGTPIPSEAVPENPDWRQIIDMARKQTVMGLVFDAVSRLPKAVQPPKNVSNQMLALSLSVIKSHAMLDSALALLVNFYRGKGIEGVLLKGQGGARYYRNPQLRQCGDIDFYVGEKNYPRAMKLATESLDSGKTKTCESEKHFQFHFERVTVELHRIAAMMHLPLRNRRMQRWTQAELGNKDTLRNLDFNGVEVNAPSADFDALYIFYHGWYHFTMAGLGLRQLCDWAMVLHHSKDKIDRERLGKLLKSFGLMKAWQILGCIVVEHLGLSADEMPFYNPKQARNAAKVMNKIMDNGNFGFYNPSRPSLSLKDIPLLKRKFYILGRVHRAYRMSFPIIPLESTSYLIKVICTGSLHTVQQMFEKRTHEVNSQMG